jgi:hypothetical protein
VVPGVATFTRSTILLIALTTLAGCASSVPQVQRATQGPTADEIYVTRFVKGYGRPPSFDETMAWREDFDRRVGEYISRQPGMIVSPRVTQFRVERRVAVGMTKEEVTLLVGLPDAIVSDEKVMEAAAKQFWPEVKKHAKEMWTYSGGWQFYFDGDRLVDLTVTGRQTLE